MAKTKAQAKSAATKKDTNAKHEKKGKSELTAKEESIVVAVGKVVAAGMDEPSRDMVKALSGNGKTPEAFKKSMGVAKKKGFLHYPNGTSVGLTDKGQSFVGTPEPGSVTNQVYHDEVIKELLNKKQCLIFDAISDGEVHNKREVAQELGYDMSKLSGYDKDLSKMSTLKFVEKTKTTIQLTDQCFPLGRPN